MHAERGRAPAGGGSARLHLLERRSGRAVRPARGVLAALGGLAPVSALLVRAGDEGACALRVLVEQVGAAAGGAELVARPIPGDEIALRVRGAPVEAAAAAGALLGDVAAAPLGTAHAD